MENNSNPIPKRYILVFDVESTGLIPKKSANNPISITDYPYIIQFSFILYDNLNHCIEISYDSYIRIPDDVIISNFINNLTGITNVDCCKKGRDIIDVLNAFKIAYNNCDVLVAHNIEFDMELIAIEIQRNREEIMKRSPDCFMLFNPIYERIKNIERYCTMLKGINICNIKTESITEGKPPRKKWPKLNELHEFLFYGEKVEGLHNSMVDVNATLKCYLKMRHNYFYSMNPIRG